MNTPANDTLSGHISVDEIPDNTPAGIERSLMVNQAGQVSDIEVSLDIIHSYIGDLSVTLPAPNGATAVLHQRAGGSRDNIVTSFNTSTTPGLQALRGPALGAWKLRIADLEAADEGKLNRWGLRLAVQ
jgi:subtilisin-like proprotein convertase family protein